MLNSTVVRLTARALLGGRRLFVLILLSSVILVLAVLLRLFADMSEADATEFVRAISFSTLLPLFGLIAGTGAVAPEIDDRSIIYLLAKPIPRATIIHSKLAVAMGVTVLFGAVPAFLAGLILVGGASWVALAVGAGAVVAGVVYSAIFLFLGVVTRHAVIVGLVYALVWESLVGSVVPGARALSVQQWALSVADGIADPGVLVAHVDFGVAMVLSVVILVAATWLAGARLRTLVIAGDE